MNYVALRPRFQYHRHLAPLPASAASTVAVAALLGGMRDGGFNRSAPEPPRSGTAGVGEQVAEVQLEQVPVVPVLLLLGPEALVVGLEAMDAGVVGDPDEQRAGVP